ncbi:MAG: hypothetical protein PHC92_07735 [Syntrophomonadaceae bacterium]|nr:hypothetical protein [Syntrophomonadaceae bacterium]MDD3023875.1 hypothetical protein [Syntrophomonadaceae bacterium]
MHWLIMVFLILVIVIILSIMGLHTRILIKDLAIKRHSLLLFALMILASIVSRIVSSKTQSFGFGLLTGPLVILFGFLPVIYIDYLRKKQAANYKGIWKKIGDWLDKPVKTLFYK